MSRAKLRRFFRHGLLPQLFGGAGHAAEAGDGLEDQELRKQPMTKETARSGTRHLGSLSVTEVWLAALVELPE